jgi:hypothetical protein
MTALEKAVEAAANASVSFAHLGKDESQRIARAVLMAVREPGDAAIRQGCVQIEDNDGLQEGDSRWTDGYAYFIPVAERSFAAMIDAILNEPQP